MDRLIYTAMTGAKGTMDQQGVDMRYYTLVDIKCSSYGGQLHML